MTVLEIPDYIDSSLDYGDLLSQMIYDDNNMFVILTDEDLDNSKVNTSIVSYYKKSNQGYEKICELKVPRSPISSASVSCTEDTKNLDKELSDTFQLNLNQNQHYSVVNWADEVSYEEPTNIPYWALIPGLDFDHHAKDNCSTTDNIDDFNQIHHQYVINWADEPMYDGPVDVPDWALIAGLDFNGHAKDGYSRRHCSTTENIDEFKQFHHQYIINWAEEPVYDGPVDVPDWALIPGLDYDRDIYSIAQENIEECDPIYHTYVINWAEEPVYEGAVDIPSWALIPDLEFNVTTKISQVGPAQVSGLDSDAKENLTKASVNWADDLSEDEPIDIPEWAMNRNLHFNRQRINAKSYFIDVVSGLSAIWE